jgi:hypothetical protein
MPLFEATDLILLRNGRALNTTRGAGRGKYF